MQRPSRPRIGRMPVQVNQKRVVMADRRTRRVRTRAAARRRAIQQGS